MKRTILYFAISLIMIGIFTSCKEDEPQFVLDDMFCFTALEPGLKVSMAVVDDTLPCPTVSLLYSLDGENWNDFIVGQTVVTLPNTGDKMYVKANGVNSALGCDNSTDETFGFNGNSFRLSKKAKVSGNIMYLLNGDHPESAELEVAAFYGLFLDDSLLMDASELKLPATRLNTGCYVELLSGTSIRTAPALPATTLAQRCYLGMFANCKNLTAAPQLPATTLAPCCYVNMFGECTSLTVAPALPATTLELACYNCMFFGCTALTVAPALPATQMAPLCYSYMFRECTALTQAPQLPATNLAERCYIQMFLGCTSLVNGPALPATILAESCYQAMFVNCSSLTNLTCLATDISATNCVTNWLTNVTTDGTLRAAAGTDWTGLIPETWTVEVVE